MKTEYLEILFWVLMGIAFVAGVALMVICAMASRSDARALAAPRLEWPELPEERSCQRSFWTRLKMRRAEERALGRRLGWSGAVRRIG